ncbi:hypothetical protein FACS1894191_3990 [Clostridia bacterium]|nr:hypothetical protein FACS1894191_3990 [Clostridia bacterium]
MNYTAPTTRLQGLNPNNTLALNLLSPVAIVPLTRAVFELSGNPVDTLSLLHKTLSGLYGQGRVSEGLDVLRLVYSALGIEYADALTLLQSDSEAASYFLHEYITDMDELLQEFAEKK